MKLHLGCGKTFIPGFVHIDAQAYPHVDHVCDIRHLPFEAEVANEIYVCHALEHFGRRQLWSVVGEFHRVLKRDGILRIAVPDVESCVQVYNQTHDMVPLMGLLYGGQRNEYDYHYVGFDFRLLQELLTQAGFEQVQRYDAFDFLPATVDDYSKAFLPHMDRQGTLMSLNVTAVKKHSMPECPTGHLSKVVLPKEGSNVIGSKMPSGTSAA